MSVGKVAMTGKRRTFLGRRNYTECSRDKKNNIKKQKQKKTRFKNMNDRVKRSDMHLASSPERDNGLRKKARNYLKR